MLVADKRMARVLAVAQSRLPVLPVRAVLELAQHHEFDVRLQPAGMLLAPHAVLRALLVAELGHGTEAVVRTQLRVDQVRVAGHRGEGVVRRPLVLVDRHQGQHLPDRAAGVGEEVHEVVRRGAEPSPGERGDVQQDAGPSNVQGRGALAHRASLVAETTSHRFALCHQECKTALCERKCNHPVPSGRRHPHRQARADGAPDHRRRAGARARARPRRVHDGAARRARGGLAPHPLQLLPQQGRRRPRWAARHQRGRPGRVHGRRSHRPPGRRPGLARPRRPGRESRHP